MWAAKYRLRGQDLAIDRDSMVKLLGGLAKPGTDGAWTATLDGGAYTLRNDTEWVETLQDRWNVLVGSDSEAISAALAQPAPTAERRNPFGAGDAAERIAQSLRDWP